MIFFIPHLVIGIVLLLWGLVTEPVTTILLVVVGIPGLFLMVFLFFAGQYWIFRLLHRLGCVDGEWDGAWKWRTRKNLEDEVRLWKYNIMSAIATNFRMK